MIKKHLRNIGIPLLGILILPAIIYSINFKNQAISGLSTDWGTFGDFIGGVANPLIGIANVLVLIYLTLKISEIDNNHKSKELELRESENQNTIMLMGFKELNSFFVKLVRILSSYDPLEENEGISLKFEFHGVIMPYIDMFKTFDDLDRVNDIGNKLLEIKKYRTSISDSKPIIEDLSKLLSDLRIEIQSITKSHIEN